MNERIKELAVQADNYAYKMNPEEDSYGRPANPRKFQQDRDTKFAELLVRECAQRCDPIPGLEFSIEEEAARAGCKKDILKGFGVEE